jgi:thioredoxin-related protein
MKTMLLSALLFLGLAGFSPLEELQIGSKMPSVENQKMKDVSGKEITLKEAMSSKGLLVMFSCNTCPYVVKNQQRTNKILGYASSQNIGVVVLNPNEAYRGKDDSYEAMKAYAAEQQYKWIYAVDENHKIADAFGATRTPECYLFDGSGTLVYHGAIDDSPADASAVKRQHLKAAIDEMNAGKSISVATSKSIGCTIKRLSKP